MPEVDLDGGANFAWLVSLASSHPLRACTHASVRSSWAICVTLAVLLLSACASLSAFAYRLTRGVRRPLRSVRHILTEEAQATTQMARCAGGSWAPVLALSRVTRCPQRAEGTERTTRLVTRSVADLLHRTRPRRIHGSTTSSSSSPKADYPDARTRSPQIKAGRAAVTKRAPQPGRPSRERARSAGRIDRPRVRDDDAPIRSTSSQGEWHPRVPALAPTTHTD